MEVGQCFQLRSLGLSNSYTLRKTRQKWEETNVSANHVTGKWQGAAPAHVRHVNKQVPVQKAEMTPCYARNKMGCLLPPYYWRLHLNNQISIREGNKDLLMRTNFNETFSKIFLFFYLGKRDKNLWATACANGRNAKNKSKCQILCHIMSWYHTEWYKNMKLPLSDHQVTTVSSVRFGQCLVFSRSAIILKPSFAQDLSFDHRFQA